MKRAALTVELNPLVANRSQLVVAISGCYWGINDVRIFNELLDSRLRAV